MAAAWVEELSLYIEDGPGGAVLCCAVLCCIYSTLEMRQKNQYFVSEVLEAGL